jgi:hypothetical protein
MDIEVAPIATSSASAKLAIPLLGISIFCSPWRVSKRRLNGASWRACYSKGMGTGLYFQPAPGNQAPNSLIEAVSPAGEERADCQCKFARVRRFD